MWEYSATTQEYDEHWSRKAGDFVLTVFKNRNGLYGCNVCHGWILLGPDGWEELEFVYLTQAQDAAEKFVRDLASSALNELK